MECIDEPVLLVGSSLGGFMPPGWRKMERPAVVINQRCARICRCNATLACSNPLCDWRAKVLVRPEYFEQLGRYRVSAPDPDRFWLLCAQDDEVDSSEMVSHHVGCKTNRHPHWRPHLC